MNGQRVQVARSMYFPDSFIRSPDSLQEKRIIAVGHRRVRIELKSAFVFPLSGTEVPLAVEIVVTKFGVAFCKSRIEFHRLHHGSFYLRTRLGRGEDVKEICKA